MKSAEEQRELKEEEESLTSTSANSSPLPQMMLHMLRLFRICRFFIVSRVMSRLDAGPLITALIFRKPLNSLYLLIYANIVSAGIH